MKVLSIINRKGGVGKTTVTANLAYELKHLGFNVLVVDLDSQCDLTKIFDKKTAEKNYTIIDLLEKRCSIPQSIVKYEDNLSIIRGDKKSDIYLPNKSSYTIKKIFSSKLFHNYDYILLDHPPANGNIPFQGLIASDKVVVVTDTEPFSYDNLKELILDINIIKSKWNQSLAILGIVINRVDMRRTQTIKSIKAIRKAYSSTVLIQHISNNSAVPSSIYNHSVLRKLHWRSPCIKQLNSLAKEILERL